MVDRLEIRLELGVDIAKGRVAGRWVQLDIDSWRRFRYFWSLWDCADTLRTFVFFSSFSVFARHAFPRDHMPQRLCLLCLKSRAILKRPKTGQHVCKDCFFLLFETEVHHTITESRLFSRGDKVAIGASGGKGNQTSLGQTVHLLSAQILPSSHML